MPNPPFRVLFGTVSLGIILIISHLEAPSLLASNDTSNWWEGTDSIVVHDDNTDVSEDVSVKIKILRNDFSFSSDWDTTSLTVVWQPQRGTTQIDIVGGCIVYTPEANYFGWDSLRYQICDMAGHCGTATVLIEVHPVNDPPVLYDDQDTTLEDFALMIDIVANDNDQLDHGLIDPATISIQGTRLPLHGNIAIDQSERKIRYVPDPNYFGNDVFEYAVCDNGYPMPAMCDTASVRVHILPANDPPQINDDIDTTFKDLLAVVEVLKNDSDSIDEIRHLDWETLSTDDLVQPRHGFTYVDNAVGMIVYVPAIGYVGLDSFQYSICDKNLLPVMCDTAWVFVYVLDQVVGLTPPGKDLFIRNGVYSELNNQTFEKGNNSGNIFPNPASTKLTFNIDQPLPNRSVFSILNSAGAEMHFNSSIDELNRYNFDISKFTTGMYFLIFRDHHKSNIYPFFKE